MLLDLKIDNLKVLYAYSDTVNEEIGVMNIYCAAPVVLSSRFHTTYTSTSFQF